MPAKPFKWTKDECLRTARQYTDRKAFAKDHGGAMAAAQRGGFHAEMTAHMDRSIAKWTEASVREAAAEFSVKDHFARAYPGAMKWAKRHGLYGDICSHMENQKRCDFDAVYLWKLKGFGDVFKVGVTSHRLKDKRIKFVSQMSGYDVDYYFVVKSAAATEVETKMLSMGKPFLGVSCSGATEFREYAPEELDACLSLMGVTKAKEVL